MPTAKTYTIGFFGCVLLTMASFAVVNQHLASGHHFPTHAELLGGLVALALAQLVVQLHYFLHLGRNSRARDLATLGFAVLLIAITVGGSLWIMANLTHQEAVPFYDSAITPQASTD